MGNMKRNPEELQINRPDVIVHKLEHGWIVMHHYRDGMEVERRYIALYPALNKEMLDAAFKALLATAAVLALLAGRPDVALVIFYILKVVVEQSVR